MSNMSIDDDNNSDQNLMMTIESSIDGHNCSFDNTHMLFSTHAKLSYLQANYLIDDETVVQGVPFSRRPSFSEFVSPNLDVIMFGKVYSDHCSKTVIMWEVGDHFYCEALSETTLMKMRREKLIWYAGEDLENVQHEWEIAQAKNSFLRQEESSLSLECNYSEEEGSVFL